MSIFGDPMEHTLDMSNQDLGRPTPVLDACVPELVKLKGLRLLRLPTMWMTQSVANAASTLPILREFILQDYGRITGHDIGESRGPVTFDVKGYFPTLERLELFGHRDFMEGFLRYCFPEIHELSKLTMRSGHGPSVHLTRCLAEHFPNLRSLEWDGSYYNENLVPIPFIIIEPLAGCTQLVELTLQDARILHSELDYLLSPWPNLKELNLVAPYTSGSIPGARKIFLKQNPHRLHLESLEIFAKRLPKLESLIVSLAATDTNLLQPVTHKFSSAFRKLKFKYTFLDYRDVPAFDRKMAVKYVSSLLCKGQECDFECPGASLRDSYYLYRDQNIPQRELDRREFEKIFSSFGREVHDAIAARECLNSLMNNFRNSVPF
jgi:hypothetical protein